MSLGFNNMMRNPRMTNLPGAVGANIIVMPNTRRGTKPPAVTMTVPLRRDKVESTKPPAGAMTVPLRRDKVESTKPPAGARTVPLRRDKVESTKVSLPPPPSHAHHGVYATVHRGLIEATSSQRVGEDGDRVFMVYPMRTEANEKISMRLKKVNSVTGQLSYNWVIVFDPSSDERFLKDFALIP